MAIRDDVNEITTRVQNILADEDIDEATRIRIIGNIKRSLVDIDSGLREQKVRVDRDDAALQARIDGAATNIGGADDPPGQPS